MKVILATDGSQHAQEAAWFLSHLPHADRLELTVLTVINVPYANQAFLSGDWLSECVDREKSLAAETFKKVERYFEGADADLRHVIREGHLGQSIVQESEDSGAELLVVGARGHSTVDRILLGSTSDYVASHAKCSVLVVRPTGLLSDDPRPIRVAIGYDRSEPSEAAIEQFSQFSWGKQTDLRVASVVSYVSAFLNEVVVDPKMIRDAVESATQEAAERLRAVAPAAQAHVIESDHIGDGLVRFIEEHDCDLVVIGDTSRNLLGRILLGSIARFVLRHAQCSVWIARSRPEKTRERPTRKATNKLGSPAE